MTSPTPQLLAALAGLVEAVREWESVGPFEPSRRYSQTTKDVVDRARDVARIAALAATHPTEEPQP